MNCDENVMLCTACTVLGLSVVVGKDIVPVRNTTVAVSMGSLEDVQLNQEVSIKTVVHMCAKAPVSCVYVFREAIK